MSAQPLPEPGWFPDPHSPGHERWWTGSEWSAVTHRSPARDLDWVPGLTRSMWIATNKPARVLRYVRWVGLLVFPGVALVVVAPVAAAVVLAIAAASELATVTIGIVALRRPPSEGSRGFATWAVAGSSVFALVSTTALVAVLVLHPAFR